MNDTLQISRKLILVFVVCVTVLIGCQVNPLIAQDNESEVFKQLQDQWTHMGHDPDFMSRYQQKTPLTPAPKIIDLEHTIIQYDKNIYTGHPRCAGFKYFGGNEMVLGYGYASSRYQVYPDVRHPSVAGRGVTVLKRSTDGGRTWPKEEEIVLRNLRIRPEAQQDYLLVENAQREKYDMFRPESLFFFTSGLFPPEQNKKPVFICRRSPNKGRTWESVPTMIKHPLGGDRRIYRHNTPVIRMPDGETLLAAFYMPYPLKGLEKETGGPAVFYSKDHGVSWHFLSRPVVNLSHEGPMVYESLLLMPNGDLHCYYLNATDDKVDGLENAIALSISKDGGKTWGEPIPAVGKGNQCWKDIPGDTGEGSVPYRSPLPILLKDGRILLTFARREMPAGIGGVISADAGQTWSDEFVIRDDARWWDLGYQVGCQLDDGRIFLAYYYNMATGGRNHGGTRYIAGSFFSIPK